MGLWGIKTRYEEEDADVVERNKRENIEASWQ